ncbi:uncharacterized protein MAM_02506 [Metarhizium album ARSEF 1941]|uniref:Uncharacterized protein n=1 Tax=Metarhizium album (strain ARSEF 1941) TaxID=1081103 RepID=A0A0B2X029_METAS|nr:uncharacterized protein MAM_02506 [Metarhizium album ARSEF 1941]KHN99653.1 hypothetical protein MAM_02506 [Metarhizium album ARSEF 1941]
MVPIPVYSSSPINAAKATGVTPKTASPGDANKGGHAQLEPSRASGEQAHSPAQPGAGPMLPKATGASQPGGVHVPATPTRTPSVGSNPPPPQPGAVPVPPGGGSGTRSGIPPPPRAGESVQNHQSPPVTTMPPPMAYQPPRAHLPAQAPSSTTSTVGPPLSGPAGISARLQGDYPATGLSMPAGGYHQDVNAAGYNSYQSAERAYEDDHEASVWDTAKKWAASAGESLAAAENEMWKRINKE